jgi:hypothetical protein
LPIKGRLKGLAVGSDSDGPLLTVWSTDANGSTIQQSRFSFIDPKTFKVLKAGPITTGVIRESEWCLPQAAVSRCTRSCEIEYTSARQREATSSGSGKRTLHQLDFNRC